MIQTMNKDDNNSCIRDLEIKDAQYIFKIVWSELVAEKGEENLRFPKEIFWLNGAPGAGKGTNTQFIMQQRDITAKPVVISELLKGPEAKKRMDAGILVGDKEVFSLLIRELLDPAYENGVIVDGFPRTQIQVECLKLFYEKITSLRIAGKLGERFIQPRFHIVVLFIDEEESIRRQLYRGQVAQSQNESVRKTDLDPEAAKRRYQTFIEETYNSLRSLKEVFHYHFINAHGSIEEVQNRILDELRYQSSLELAEATFSRLNKLPLASEIIKHARQQLVFRLDDYELNHTALFKKVVDLIESRFMPIIHRHAISGKAVISTEDQLFEDPLALAMLIDVFSERGYQALVDVKQQELPDRIDPQTHKIITRQKRIYRVKLEFKGSNIRRGH